MICLDFKIAVNPADADFNGPAVGCEAAGLEIKKCDAEERNVWHDVLTLPFQK